MGTFIVFVAVTGLAIIVGSILGFIEFLIERNK